MPRCPTTQPTACQPLKPVGRQVLQSCSNGVCTYRCPAAMAPLGAGAAANASITVTCDPMSGTWQGSGVDTIEALECADCATAALAAVPGINTTMACDNGGSCTAMCMPGHYKTGGSAQLSCSSAGSTWQGDPLVCSPCSDPPAPPAMHQLLTGCQAGKCSYECKPGYFAASPTPAGGMTTSTCDAMTGMWSHPANLACTRCSDYPAPMWPFVESTCMDGSCQHSCAPGFYQASPSNTSKCMASTDAEAMTPSWLPVFQCRRCDTSAVSVPPGTMLDCDDMVRYLQPSPTSLHRLTQTRHPSGPLRRCVQGKPLPGLS